MTDIQTVKCEECGKVLTIEYGADEPTCGACDILEVTKLGDTWRTFIPLFPVSFYCQQHARNSKVYNLGENNNVRI